jgi:hypothetical protein
MLNDVSIELNRNVFIIPFKELETKDKSKNEIRKEYIDLFLKREIQL